MQQNGTAFQSSDITNVYVQLSELYQTITTNSDTAAALTFPIQLASEQKSMQILVLNISCKEQPL